MKKLFFSGVAVLTIVGSAFAFAPKGNTIFCALTSQGNCNIATIDKEISPVPTQEQGFCVVASQQAPCPLVDLRDRP